MTKAHSVKVNGGKYTFINRGLSIEILRYGEPWHSQEQAFNALRSLMVELDAARVVLQAARELGDQVPPNIRDAMKRHQSLVDDRETSYTDKGVNMGSDDKPVANRVDIVAPIRAYVDNDVLIQEFKRVGGPSDGQILTIKTRIGHQTVPCPLCAAPDCRVMEGYGNHHCTSCGCSFIPSSKRQCEHGTEGCVGRGDKHSCDFFKMNG